MVIYLQALKMCGCICNVYRSLNLDTETQKFVERKVAERILSENELRSISTKDMISEVNRWLDTINMYFRS